MFIAASRSPAEAVDIMVVVLAGAAALLHLSFS